MRKTIIHIIDSLGRGGAENLLVNSVNALHNYHHVVVCLHNPDTLKAELKQAEFISLDLKGRMNFLKIRSKLKQIIKTRNAQIVHSHSYLTNIICRLAVVGEAKLFNSYHFADYETQRNSFVRYRMIIFDRITYFKTLNIICVSEYVQEVLRKSCGYTKNITTVRNYVSDKHYRPAKNAIEWKEGDVLQLISVGNLKSEKNYALLINAFRTLEHYPVKLDVYGDGDSLHFRKELAKANIQNLNFKGPSELIDEILPAYHAYVMCSYSEACPLSPLEAISAGLPMILSDIPALKEIANENAWYFKSNDVASFIELILSILNREVELSCDKEAYATILTRYSKQQYLAALNELYEPGSKSPSLMKSPYSRGDVMYKNPYTSEHLKLCDDGLVSNGRVLFPNVNGAVRIVNNKNYTSNFGFQWGRFRTTQIDKNLKNINHSRDRFFAATGWDKEDLTDARILEVGCGAGRFSQIVLDFTKGCLYSVDYSNSVEDNFLNNSGYGKRFKLFQASIYDMPFEKEQFDKVFCFGVLQHTPDVKRSISCLSDMVKEGGELVVDFYPRLGWWTKIHAKYMLRFYTKKISHEKLLIKIERNIDWMISLSLFFNRIGLGKVLNRFIPICDFTSTFPANLTKEQLKEWCILDTFDMFSPAFDQPQRIPEVKKWFEQLGFENIFADFINYSNNNRGVVVKGLKRHLPVKEE